MRMLSRWPWISRCGDYWQQAELHTDGACRIMMMMMMMMIRLSLWAVVFYTSDLHRRLYSSRTLVCFQIFVTYLLACNFIIVSYLLIFYCVSGLFCVHSRRTIEMLSAASLALTGVVILCSAPLDSDEVGMYVDCRIQAALRHSINQLTEAKIGPVGCDSTMASFPTLNLPCTVQRRLYDCTPH